MEPRRPLRGISVAALLAGYLALSGCAGAERGALTGRPAKPPVSAEESVALMVRYCDKLRLDGDLVAAAALCKRALEYAPTDKTVLMSLGQILEAMNAPREAARAYRRVLTLAPDDNLARYGLGKAYLRLGQYDFAEEQLEIALSSAAGTARLYSMLGVVRDKMGRHRAAQEVYRAGLALYEYDIPLRTNLGLSLVLSGQNLEGIDLLREVAADPAAGVASRQGLAFAYALTGNMAAAESIAVIDLPVEAARATLAHYESLRRAGVGAPPAAPSLASHAAGAEASRAAQGPVDLLRRPAATAPAPARAGPKNCRTGSEQPFCAGKY